MTKMSNLISIAAAIDAVHKDYDTILDFKSDGATVASSIEDILLALPSVQPEQQWTPCSERLPEEESEVLVTTSWNDVCKAWYSNGKWRAEFINEYDDGEILAWMPLPEPYQKQGDQNGKN